MATERIEIKYLPDGICNGQVGCYLARFIDEPGKWEAGTSGMEALGKLVVSFPERFNVAEIVRRD